MGELLLPMGKQLFLCDQFPREISMDTSKRTKELPMTVPEVRSIGQEKPRSGPTNHEKVKCTKQ